MSNVFTRRQKQTIGFLAHPLGLDPELFIPIRKVLASFQPSLVIHSDLTISEFHFHQLALEANCPIKLITSIINSIDNKTATEIEINENDDLDDLICLQSDILITVPAPKYKIVLKRVYPNIKEIINLTER